jgi:glycosyltransferase involved in cell wall biosynthesis
MGYTFSICIPTYNSGALVAYAIDSALKQDFSDYEILIVDDKSTDTTLQEINKYAALENVCIVVNDKNLGLTANWNKCLQLAKGKYIAFLHHDDEFEPTLLSKVFDVIKSDQSIGIVAVDNQTGKTNELKKGFISASDYINTLFLFKYATPPSQCIFIKTDDLEYDMQMKYCPEVDLYLQLLEKKYNVFYLQKKLVKRNAHNWTGNVTSVTNFTTIPFEDKLYIIHKWASKIKIEPHIVKNGFANLSIQAYKKYIRGVVFNAPGIKDFKLKFDTKVNAYKHFNLNTFERNKIAAVAYFHMAIKMFTSVASKLYKDVKKIN